MVTDRGEFEQTHTVCFGHLHPFKINDIYALKQEAQGGSTHVSIPQEPFPQTLWRHVTGIASQHGPSHSDPHLLDAWLLPQCKSESMTGCIQVKDPGIRKMAQLPAAVVTPFS